MLTSLTLALLTATLDIPKAETFRSPAVEALNNLLLHNKGAEFEKKLSEIERNLPYVEAAPNDTENVLVTYLYHDDGTLDEVRLFGGVPTFVPKIFQRLGDTKVLFRTELTPRTARFGYLLGLRHKGSPKVDFVPDPMNHHLYADESSVTLPDAPPQPWSDKRPGVPAGKITEHSIHSSSLSQDREFAVYTPAGYSSRQRYPLVLVLDGESYGGDADEDPAAAAVPTPIILDNLVAEKKIPPVVALFLVSGPTRDADFSCNPKMSSFLKTELMRWARDHYSIAQGGRNVVVTGSSRTGLGALYTCWHDPETFGNALSLSGAFWWDPVISNKRPAFVFYEGGWLTREILKAPKRNVRVFMTAGEFEALPAAEILSESRRLRDVLTAKGYDLDYREFMGGHNYLCWRGLMADGLISLLGQRH